MAKLKDQALSELKAKQVKAQKEIVIPKLTAAQIQNRRYSIYIKKLSLDEEVAKSSSDVEKASNDIK